MGVDASQIDPRDYYCGGYFLIRANTSGYNANRPLLPDTIISLSECICLKLKIGWGWIPGDKEAALAFGIPEDKFDEFKAWSGPAHDVEMGLWSVFYSPDYARRFIERFLPDAGDLYLIGIGLHKELVGAFWQGQLFDVFWGQSRGVLRDQSSYEKDYHYATERLIKRLLPLERGGKPLGYEVVSGVFYGDFGHSWLCSLIDVDMHELYGIRPNAYGLIDTYPEAKQVYEWIAEDEMQGGRSEPEPYNAWLLVSYPLTDDAP
jgi:hypothetical protein